MTWTQTISAIRPKAIASLLVVVVVVLVVSWARPHAGSWNDGSRLAAVESLLERGTLQIDDSIFCQPAESTHRGYPPYGPSSPDLNDKGTRDKLFVDGHFYSDKPAVITFLMAAMYRAVMVLGAPSPLERPDLFCWILTVLSAGAAFGWTAVNLVRLSATLNLTPRTRTLWIASFALATFALAYTRHVNNHIMQLAVVTAICLHAFRLADEVGQGKHSYGRLAWIGTLAGLGFNLDFGSGPLLVAVVGVMVLLRCQRFTPAMVYGLAVAPWVAAGLGLNYAIGGVWKPINMVPEYSAWPGSPFSPENLTGFSRHGPWQQFVYALALMFGKHGFLVHNLPLLLVVPAGIHLARRPNPYRRELACLLGWCVGAWLMYAALSNNYGGACCSIRWFVPFLGPAYLLLAVYLRDTPGQGAVFAALSGVGAVLGISLWLVGPWTARVPPLLWPAVATALVAWLSIARRQRRAADRRDGAGPSFKKSLNVQQMRFLDRWMGVPACFILTIWRKVSQRAVPSTPPRSILFIKLAEQGSTVLAQQAIHEAVDRVGRDHVYFLVFAENRAILDLLDLIPPGNIFVIETRGAVSAAVNACKTLWRIRRAGIDAAIDLEFFARSSAALAFLTGAARRVGFHAWGGEASYRGDLLTHRVPFNPYLHTSQAFDLLVRSLDQDPERFPVVNMTPTPAAPAAGRFVSREVDIASVQILLRREFGSEHAHAPLLLLNANASDLMPLRRWSPDRYVELARRLLNQYPEAMIGFTGGPAEQFAVEKLVAAINSSRCRSLAGKTSLRELLTLYERAEVLVTNDSGPAHFATLTPIDVVVLFGPETPRLFAGLSRGTHVIWAGLSCSPCINAFNDRQSACTDNVCMQRISVDQVFERVCDAFEKRRAMIMRFAAPG